MASKGFTIRIEEEMLKRINYVADYEGRSVNSHVLALIRTDISRFVKEHGEIGENIRPELNIKPTRKP